MRDHRPTGGRGWSATGPRTLVTPWTAPDLAGLADKRLDHDSARRQKGWRITALIKCLALFEPLRFTLFHQYLS